MEPFLTLAIAVGGIATGIGAIWAAVVARRQADLTARSLAQTERSLAEQNERSRLHLEAELLFKFDDRWKSPLSLTQRRSAAKYLIENAFLDNDPVELPHLSDATEYVCGFFEMVGHFQSLGAMQADRLLAYVRLDGALFNETLLRQGFAQLYIVSPNDKYEARFRQAQQQAKSAERGIWGLTKQQQCELADRGNGIGEGSPGCASQSPQDPDENPTTDSSGSGQDKDCASFSSQAEAQAEYDADPTDLNGLDANNDGQACEDYDYGVAADQRSGGNADDQYADRRDDVIPGTFEKRPLPGTGGPPLLLVPWLLTLVGVGVALLRK